MTEVKKSVDHLEINKIAYEQVTKSLDSQNSDLSALRQRATAVVSVGGLVSALLGKEALKEPSGKELWLNLGTVEWLALVCLLVSVVCTFQILRSRDGWIFNLSSSKIINQFSEGEKSTDLSMTYKILAIFSEDNFIKNNEMLKLLYRWLNGSLIAVTIQIILWMFAM